MDRQWILSVSRQYARCLMPIGPKSLQVWRKNCHIAVRSAEKSCDVKECSDSARLEDRQRISSELTRGCRPGCEPHTATEKNILHEFVLNSHTFLENEVLSYTGTFVFTYTSFRFQPVAQYLLFCAPAYFDHRMWPPSRSHKFTDMQNIYIYIYIQIYIYIL
jgi:hypothetical protein